MNTNPTPVTPTAEDAQEVAADLRKLIDSAPASIWLDLGEDFDMTLETDFRDLREVSWSADNTTGVGIKYVRAPVAVATSDAERATLLQDLHNALYRAQTTESALVLMESVGKARLLLSRYRSALPIDFKQAIDQGGAAWYMLKASGEKLNPHHGEPSADAREWAEICGMRIVILYAAPTLLGVADGDAVGGKSGGAK